MTSVFNHKRKYTHGISVSSTIFLFYQDGWRRKRIEIPHSRCPWYFIISRADFRKHKPMIVSLYEDGLIKKVEPYGNDFMAIFCKTTNLKDWQIDQGESDDKVEIIRVFESSGIETYESDLSPLSRFLVDHDVQIEDDYYKAYFDIETDDRSGKIDIGASRILSIAFTDSFDKSLYLTARKEETLLKEIVRVLRRYAIIVGYNSKGFDFPYIQARCEHHGIELDTSDQIHIDLWERIIDLYKFDKEGPRRYSLDAVSEHFLGEHKVELQGGYYWSWIHDHDRFRRYNIRDTKLLKRLDDKLEIIPTMALQAKICGTFLNEFWNTKLADMYLLRLAHKKRIALPKKVERPKEQMPGGCVFKMVPGIYNNVQIWDFSQMYSTVMRSFNISPETVKIVKDSEYLEFHKDRGQYVTSAVELVVKHVFTLAQRWAELNRRECSSNDIEGSPDWVRISSKNLADDLDLLKAYLSEEIQKVFTIKNLRILRYFLKIKKIDTKNDTGVIELVYCRRVFFKKDPKGLLREMLQTYVDERNRAKSERDKHEKGSPDWKTWEKIQLAFKLMGNVVFGYVSSHRNRCYSHALACSITLGGQCIINLVRKVAPKVFPISVIYGDTDSNFIQHREKPVSLDKFNSDYTAWFRQFITNKLKKYFNIDEHCMSIEGKTFYDVLLLIGKKNYIGFDREAGTYEAMGIDYVKRSTIPYTKKLQRFLVEKLLKDESFRDAERIERWALRKREKFFKLKLTPENIGQFAISTRVTKKAEEYANEPAHARIVERMLADQQQFFIGSILQWVIVKSSSKKMEGEEVTRFFAKGCEMDRERYWESHIWSKVKRILKIVFPEKVWESLSPREEEARQKRIEKFKKGLADKKRREAAIVAIQRSKVMHETDKEALMGWAREQRYVD
jgi:DNA polymerase elongation subunit (family B)